MNLIHPATIVSRSFVEKVLQNDDILLSHPTFITAKKAILDSTPINFTPHALQTVDIDHFGTGQGHPEIKADCEQLYTQALAYLLSKKEIYAENVLNIMKTWSETCTTFTGSNAPLEGAWMLASMARGIEIIKYIYPNYNYNIHNKFVNWIKTTVLPHLLGQTSVSSWIWGDKTTFNNWHTSTIEARLQFAILTDNVIEINNCVNLYKAVFSKYVNDNGLTGESFRDSDHCCFGLAGMINICEILHNINIDVYTLRDNLLMKCVELHAGVYCFQKVPPGYSVSQFNCYCWIQPSSWEIAYNHFCNRLHLSMPNTLGLLSKTRPSKYQLHWGYDTLTHSVST